MKIVVIGGHGLIGTKLQPILAARGHQVIPVSRGTGVDVLTGAGLDEALTGADVVVDLTNSPSWEDQAVLDFFTTAGAQIAKAEKTAGVRHHVALSIAGTDRVPDSGYLRAKVAQEQAIKDGGVPYTIVRATQFHEFVPGIADWSTADGVVRMSTGAFQPVAGDDVAETVADVAVAPAANETIELGGPETAPMADFVRRYLTATGDSRTVEGDPKAPYFGAVIDDTSLVTGPGARIGAITFAQWMAR